MFFDASAFAIGMVALINPCGFALLPAYLGFFLGMDEEDNPSTILAVSRAQKVGLSMSAGFLAVFGILGVFLAGALTALNESGALPWITMVIGVALFILGIAMLFGFQLLISIPKLSKGGDSRSFTSMFLFGVSYAVASLSCTIGLFIGTIGATAAADTGFFERFGKFISYGLGMGLLATGLTLAVGFGKKGIVNRFKQILPHINRISAVLLVIVGIYVTLYGVWSQQVFDSSRTAGPTPWIDTIVLTAEGWQAGLAGWFDGQVALGSFSAARTTILGWGFLILNLIVAAGGFIAGRSKSIPVAEPETVG